MTSSPPPEPAHNLTGLPSSGAMIAGKYLLGEVIGVGGMGVVLAGEHVELQQPVAVKLLLPRVALYPGARDRFVREARAAARIPGEHAVRILDVGTTEDGVAYMTMERLEGSDLSALLQQRGQLPATEAVDFVLQAIEGVSAAHAVGVVHRDLKPSNLFLAQRKGGRSIVKVLDFGISKTLTGSDAVAMQTLTDPNAPIGSPQYMAPEQIVDGRSVDARADLWALGVILYELLSGQPPFDAASISHLFVKILHEPQRPLSEMRPDLPEALVGVIAACLTKDPGLRVASCAELRRLLLPFASERMRARLANAHDAEGEGEAPIASSPRAAFNSVPASASTDAFRATELQGEARGRGSKPGLVAAAALVLAAAAVFAALRTGSAPPPGGGPTVATTAAASTPPPSVMPAQSATAASAADPPDAASSAPTSASGEPAVSPDATTLQPLQGAASSVPRAAAAPPVARPTGPRPATSTRVKGLGDIRPID